MIQLVRHQFSRKRDSCFSGDLTDNKVRDEADEQELLEIVRDNQLDDIGGTRPKKAIDRHIDDLIDHYMNLMDTSSSVLVSNNSKSNTLTAQEAELQLSSLKDNALQRLSGSSEVKSHSSTTGKPFLVDNKKFYYRMNKGQVKAGEYILRMLNKGSHNDQLLMLLHGPPGTGKSTLINRLKAYTNVDMRITATSGIAAMSLKGTTIDWFLGLGRRKLKRTKVEVVNGNLGDATLLVVDEVSMLGCHKLLQLDATLRKLKKVDAPFGGLDIIFVGDFGQLPAVRQLSIMDAMVNTTHTYTQPPHVAIKTTALMRQFRKFELWELTRSQKCTFLSSLIANFRRTDRKDGSITCKELKDIGVASRDTFKSDEKFRHAPFLVATRKEKDALTLRAGRLWAERNGVPLYW